MKERERTNAPQRQPKQPMHPSKLCHIILHDTEYRQTVSNQRTNRSLIYDQAPPLHHSTQIKEERVSQPQSLPNLIPHLPLILPPPLPPHLRSLHVRRRLIIRLRQHTHNGDENLLHALDRRPPLRSMFVMVGVVTGGVEDGNAHGSVGVYYTYVQNTLA